MEENDKSADEDIEEVAGSDANAATTTASFQIGEKVINCAVLRGIIENLIWSSHAALSPSTRSITLARAEICPEACRRCR